VPSSAAFSIAAAQRCSVSTRPVICPYDSRNADLLFEVVSRRYEKRSTLLTTNLAFRDWPSIFPNAACVTALIDRVIHHADVVAIEGDSYRKREAEEHKARRKSRG